MLKNPILKTGAKFGIIGGFLAAILFIILYVLDQNPLLTTKKIPFGIILLPLLVFFSIKEFRDYFNGGELRFWQGLVTGFVNYLIIALISSVFIFVFLSYYDQELLQELINFNILNFERNKAGFIETFDEDTYEKVLADIRKTTVYHIALDDFARKMLIGFIATFIISIFLRK